MASISAFALLPHVLVVAIAALPIIGMSVIAGSWLVVQAKFFLPLLFENVDTADNEPWAAEVWSKSNLENIDVDKDDSFITKLGKIYLAFLKKVMVWGLVSERGVMRESVEDDNLEVEFFSTTKKTQWGRITEEEQRPDYVALRDQGFYVVLKDAIKNRWKWDFAKLLFKHAKYRLAAILAALGLGIYLAQALVPFIMATAVTSLGLSSLLSVFLGIFAAVAIIAMTYQVLALATLLADIWKNRIELKKDKELNNYSNNLSYATLAQVFLGTLGLGLGIYASTLFFAPLVQALTPVVGAGLATFSALAVSVSLAVLLMKRAPEIARLSGKAFSFMLSPITTPVGKWASKQGATFKAWNARRIEEKGESMPPITSEASAQESGKLRTLEQEKKTSWLSCWYRSRNNEPEADNNAEGASTPRRRDSV